MPLVTGPTQVAPTSGQVLVEVSFARPRHVRANIIVTTTYGFDALLEVWDAAGSVIQDFVVKVGQTQYDSPEYGPLTIQQNGRIRLVMRHTPETMPAPLEVQASIFYRDWGER